MLSTDNTVFATNLDDLETFEDTYNKAKDLAALSGGEFSTEVVSFGENEFSVIFNVTTTSEDGKKTTASFTAITFEVDTESNIVSTSGVNKEEE